VIDGMAAEDAEFRGVLYCGLMITARGPKVLEFNARFGDPETQAILMRLESDLLDALEACADGALPEVELRWQAGASACVVAASGGYPGKFEVEKPIAGLQQAAEVEGVKIFHAGTQPGPDGTLRTSGGRVLVTAASAPTLGDALARCYEAMSKIHFDGMVYRRDIGRRRLARKDVTR
jgi:phosphoribosylamine--glycine ligase